MTTRDELRAVLLRDVRGRRELTSADFADVPETGSIATSDIYGREPYPSDRYRIAAVAERFRLNVLSGITLTDEYIDAAIDDRRGGLGDLIDEEENA